MTRVNQLEGTLNCTAVTSVDVLYQHLCGEADEMQRKPQSEYRSLSRDLNHEPP
jgi:hypothetical protein